MSTAQDGVGDLAHGELELLLEGLDDELSFAYVLEHLGLFRYSFDASSGGWNYDVRPDPTAVAEAFESLDRLVGRGLVTVTSRHPYIHNKPRLSRPRRGPSDESEPLELVRRRVEKAIRRRRAPHWEWDKRCWVSNTTVGDARIEAVIAERSFWFVEDGRSFGPFLSEADTHRRQRHNAELGGGGPYRVVEKSCGTERTVGTFDLPPSE